MTPRSLGRTGLAVSPLCVGTSPLASMPFLYGYPVTERQAVATVDAVLTRIVDAYHAARDVFVARGVPE